MSNFSNFLDIQTKTGWGRTLANFASFCNAQPDSTILDVGCGPGLLPLIFTQAGHMAYGVDSDYILISSSLSSNLLQSEASRLPFPSVTFHLITATNLLFLFNEPLCALKEWKRLLQPEGYICLLNPSEHLNVSAAAYLAKERGLDGTARDSLINWALTAEQHVRWTEDEMRKLLTRAGLKLVETALHVGPGFARFVRAALQAYPSCNYWL